MIKKYINAYSLVELLVVLVITIILAIATISYFKMDKYYQNNQIDEIYTLMKKARISGLQNNKDVVICSSNNGITCDTNNLWAGKFIISFISNDGTSEYNSKDDYLLGRVETPNPNFYYQWSRFPTTSFIKIKGKGHSLDGTLTLCQKNDAYKRILINSTGNITIEDPLNNDACNI
ncbi:GspH/FimT family protein [Francisella marina]|nr:GspH/FimT family protein [Francisella marina]